MKSLSINLAIFSVSNEHIHFSILNIWGNPMSSAAPKCLFSVVYRNEKDDGGMRFLHLELFGFKYIKNFKGEK